MTCPKCKSENVNVSIVNQAQLVKKHHGVVWWLLIGWWWVPIWWMYFTLFAIIVAIFAPKRQKLKYKEKTVCVCQNCGHSWEIK